MTEVTPAGTVKPSVEPVWANTQVTTPGCIEQPGGGSAAIAVAAQISAKASKADASNN